VEVLDRVEAGRSEPRPQDHDRATYTGLVRKEDGRIDWNLPAVQIDRMVRAYTPWPRAFTTFGAERLNVLDAVPVPVADQGDKGAGRAAGEPVPGTVLRVDTSTGILVETGNGRLALRRLQLQSRKPLDWRSFLNGVQGFVGAVLGGS